MGSRTEGDKWKWRECCEHDGGDRTQQGCSEDKKGMCLEALGVGVLGVLGNHQLWGKEESGLLPAMKIPCA